MSRKHKKWSPGRDSRAANVGHPGLPPEKKPHARNIDTLIEASSLGTPSAKAFRDSVSEEDARRIVDRVNQMRDGEMCEDCGCWTGGADCPHCVPVAPHPRGRS